MTCRRRSTLERQGSRETRFEGLADHPFPDCFACGTDRDPADALCLRPGPLDDGTGRYAATWAPREADRAAGVGGARLPRRLVGRASPGDRWCSAR